MSRSLTYPKTKDKKRKFNRKFAKVMREYKHDRLFSSSGHKVRNPKQAKAIALSEARRVVGRR